MKRILTIVAVAAVAFTAGAAAGVYDQTETEAVHIDPDTGTGGVDVKTAEASSEDPRSPVFTVVTVPPSTTTTVVPAPPTGTTAAPAGGPEAPAEEPATDPVPEMTATVSVRYHSENVEHNARYPEDDDHLVELVFTGPEGWTARWSHKGHSCGLGYRNPNPYRHSPGHEHGRVWRGHCWPLDWSTNTVNAPGGSVLISSEPITEVCEWGESRDVRVQFLPPVSEREYIHGRRPGDPMRLGVQYPPMGAKWLLNHVLQDVSWCFENGEASGFRTGGS